MISNLLFGYFGAQVVYKIKLPGPAILGEGKPENQNHAIIFTRGEGLQTIDMNQVLHLFIYERKKGSPTYEKTHTAKHSCNRITIWKKLSK